MKLMAYCLSTPEAFEDAAYRPASRDTLGLPVFSARAS